MATLASFLLIVFVLVGTFGLVASIVTGLFNGPKNTVEEADPNEKYLDEYGYFDEEAWYEANKHTFLNKEEE